jgi:uncharacterized membrane protein (UPF0136 family)
MAGESYSSASTTAALAPTFDWIALARGLAGAMVGGVVGYFVFQWLASRGLLAHMVPGVLLGMAAGWSARRRIVALGVICAIAALVLTIVAEWIRAPFVADESLTFFVTHLTEMNNATFKLVALGLGAAAAYWFGQGR